MPRKKGERQNGRKVSWSGNLSARRFSKQCPYCGFKARGPRHSVERTMVLHFCTEMMEEHRD